MLQPRCLGAILLARERKARRKDRAEALPGRKSPLSFTGIFVTGTGCDGAPTGGGAHGNYSLYGNDMYRNFSIVPKIMFGRGSFNQLGDILAEHRTGPDSYMVFVLDDVLVGRPLEGRLPLQPGDMLLPVNVDDEPKTSYIDQLVAKIRAYNGQQPAHGLEPMTRGDRRALLLGMMLLVALWLLGILSGG